MKKILFIVIALHLLISESRSQQGVFSVGFSIGIPKMGMFISYSITDYTSIETFFGGGPGAHTYGIGFKHYLTRNYDRFISFGYFGLGGHEYGGIEIVDDKTIENVAYSSTTHNGIYFSAGNDFNLKKYKSKLPADLGFNYYFKKTEIKHKVITNSENEKGISKSKNKTSDISRKWFPLFNFGIATHFKLKKVSR